MLKTKYKDKDLFFTQIIPYTGPVPLKIYEEYEIFRLDDNIIVYINNGYYIIKSLTYNNVLYDIKKKKDTNFFKELLNED